MNLHSLISRFRDDPRRRLATYNETEARVQYINPLFEFLGWDMGNRTGRNEVKHEDRVTIRDKAKAPDYGFYLDGRRRFFVEAKKPAVNIGQTAGPAYQLRRYAWTAKLPVSVLTDFEEFAVYDTRVRPEQGDRADAARIGYWTYDQYPDAWDEIAATFSREAVLGGSLEQFAEARGGKRGVAPVDAELLREIERWRELLARNIALRNPGLTERDLNFAVQQTIDRLLFLRIAEDRAIEPYGRLKGLLSGGDIYSRLMTVYNQADARYNSGLFHFAPERGRGDPDYLTPRLTIDDKALHDIIRNLYEPVSPYEFSVFPADILGQVYEQFLGKVIRLSGKSATVEEKPEVRKAGGVYYTPTYIVDYIVAQTVGKLLEGHTPDPTGPVSRLRVLDPACGSGSFLLGAYQYLLDWHLRGYLAAPSKWSKGRGRTLHQTAAGEYHLTLAERKRILLDNLYGVDIDPQAVEVTKLSLLLKVLEDSADALAGQMALLPERVLPDLGENIKCGNSLIGPDFYDLDLTGRRDQAVGKSGAPARLPVRSGGGAQMPLFDLNEQMRVNAFDWRAEFRGVMDVGGFDAVIGNPPYLNIDDTWGKGDSRLVSIKKSYPHIYNDKTDILFYFLAKAVDLSKGYVSFIVSRAFLEAYKADKLRGYLSSRTAVRQIIDFQNFYIFPGVGITTCIVTLQPNAPSGDVEVFKLRGNDVVPSDLPPQLLNSDSFERIEVSQSRLGSESWALTSPIIAQLNQKIDAAGDPVDSILIIGKGMETGRNNVFGKRTLAEIAEWEVPQELFFKRATNSDIQRYFIRDRGEYILYPQPVKQFKQLPQGMQSHLVTHKKELQARAAYQRGDCEWWKFTWPLHEAYYDRKRIVCPYLATFNRFALDENREFLTLTDTTVLFENAQAENLLYLLGLLNSRLLSFRFRNIGKLKSDGIYEYFWNSISKLPIRRIDPTNPTDAAAHAHMVELVQRMLDLHKQHAAERNPQVKTMLQRQIDATDRQIDRLVYELYGLTDEEIGIVEGQT